MKKVVLLALLLTLLVSVFSCTYASGMIPSVFLDEVSPHGYNVSDSVIARKALEYGTSTENAKGRSATLDRHNALIAAGWELVSVDVEYFDEPLANSFSTTADSGIVIEGTRVVTSSYRQPRQTKSKYNNKLLDGISNYSTTISSVFAAAMPKCKWIPKAFGFTSKAIVDASATKKSTYEVTATLRYYDVEVKIEGHSNYFMCATSEKYEAAATLSVTGWKANNTPFSSAGSGSASTKSAHYGNKTYLTEKARYYALQNHGTFYSEDAPTLSAVKVTAN